MGLPSFLNIIYKKYLLGSNYNAALLRCKSLRR